MKRSIWVRLIAMILVISMLAAPVSAATVRGPGHSTNGLIGAIIGIIKDIIKEIIDDWFDIPGVGDPDPTEPPVPTTPEEPTAPSEPVVTDPTEPVVTEPVETEPEVTEPETPVFEQTLVEGHANTVNGNLLRGVTYSLSQLVAQEPQTAPYALRSPGYAQNAVAEETTSEPEQPDQPEEPEQSEGDLIYFPVTMFTYDEDVIRRLTNQAEVEAGLKDTWQGLYFSGGSPSATKYT